MDTTCAEYVEYNGSEAWLRLLSAMRTPNDDSDWVELPATTGEYGGLP